MGMSIKLEGVNPQKCFDRIFNKKEKIFMHQTAANLMHPFVPNQQGILASSTNVTEDYVEYTQPYSRYLYYGKLMLAKNGSSYARKGERKYLTSTNLKYSKDKSMGLATSHWDKAMMKSKGAQFLRDVQKDIDRR